MMRRCTSVLQHLSMPAMLISTGIVGIMTATVAVASSLAPATLAPAPAVPAVASPATGGLQVLFGLIVVLGLLAGAAWLLKRYGPVRGVGSSNIKIIGGVSVGNRERVIVVEVADQWIVVGVAPGQVSALSTMPRQEDASPIASTAARGANAPASNFSGWLKQTIDKRNGIR